MHGENRRQKAFSQRIPQQSPRKKTEAVLPKSAEGLPAKPAPLHWKTVLQALAIVAAGLCIYWPALYGGWLWDDDVLVTNNSNLHSLRGLWAIWSATPTTDYWPLTSTFLWIEWHLWGNDPLGYHLCSLALHICSGFLIWRLFNRLGLRWGWFGALLFVIHPLAVELVAWVSEIKNTLSLPFFLLSIDAWLDAEEKQSSGYWRSVFYYLAAMLAKTSTVMLPLVLLLYCWWKRGHVTWQELKRMIPYVAIAVTLGLITVYFQNKGQGDNPIELGGATRLIGAGTALFHYLGKFILPMNLMPIYPRWTLAPPSFLQVLAFPALAALLFGLWTQRGGWGRHALLGFGFFLLNLLPVLGLVKMRYMNISWAADHLAYVPIVGLVGLVVLGLEQLHERLSSFSHLFGIEVMSIAMVTGSLLWESHNYARLFSNSKTLWAYTVQHNPQSSIAHNNLGDALLNAGRVSEAIEQFEQALKIKPDDPYAHNNFGNALMTAGRMSEAVEQLQQALKVKPDYAEARNNLGAALVRSGSMSEGIEQLEQALSIKPDYAEAHYNAGIAFLRTGRVSEAIGQLGQALKIKPNYAEAHNNLGAALIRTGRISEAIEQFEQALKIRPDDVEAHNNLGIALVRAGRVAEAIEQYEQALKIKPDYAVARNLANAQAILKSNPAKN